MSYDGFVTHSVVSELNNTVMGGKIDKIYQPEKDEIIIAVRTFKGSYRLLLSASASNARVHLTSVKRENPMTPPMLCMLMRKHLCGGTISKITQNDFDRVINIEISSHNELGDECTYSLITEIMGRHSNIILVDENKKIMDSAKHIDFTVSAVRQILPGLIYEEPPKQDKRLADSLSMTDFMNDVENLADDVLMDKFLVNEFMGMSPLLARELVYRFAGNTHVIRNEIDTAAFVVFVSDTLKKLCNNDYTPSLVIDNNKKPTAFSCIHLSQYDSVSVVEENKSISAVIDNFYETRSLRERMNRRSAVLLKTVHNNIERCEKKLIIHKESLTQAANKEKYKIYGDLLTANIYKIKFGMKNVTVENYYSDNCELIEIKLDETKSPSQNAQRYYKKYNKLKTAELFATEQIEEAEKEKYYLESVAEALENVENSAELDDIRAELEQEGYIKSVNTKKKKNQIKSAPLSYTSSDGYEILVGRNNRQNDELTIRMAYSTDLWFHTKQIPGSHTIVRTRGEKDIPETTILEAAKLAAYHSKARNSSQVPVDYTIIKNVKKPNGAKPGMVIYDSYNTLYVLPETL